MKKKYRINIISMSQNEIKCYVRAKDKNSALIKTLKELKDYKKDFNYDSFTIEVEEIGK